MHSYVYTSYIHILLAYINTEFFPDTYTYMHMYMNVCVRYRASNFVDIILPRYPYIHTYIHTYMIACIHYRASNFVDKILPICPDAPVVLTMR